MHAHDHRHLPGAEGEVGQEYDPREPVFWLQTSFLSLDFQQQKALSHVPSFIAALLHYFFLAAFAWMLLEGFQIYLMPRLARCGRQQISMLTFFIHCSYIYRIHVAGSVTIDLALVPESRDMCKEGTSYGTPDFCWLRVDNHFILIFIVPAAMLLNVNMRNYHVEGEASLRINPKRNITTKRIFSL